MIDKTWADAAIESCLQHGIDHFFLAPGSRCTPLTLAVARRSEATTVQHFDERGLAFAALGFGRATGRPGVFICTSGTAVANAYAAVIESSMESVPLLLFTADRPEELQGSGANQTIDQQEIFGNYPRLFLNMPVPANDNLQSEREQDGPSFVTAQVARVVGEAMRGPVHVNWMFREPFTISDPDQEFVNPTADAPAMGLDRKSIPASKNDSQQSEQVVVRGNTLIALGQCRPEEAEEALALSKRLNCPLLCDVTSGLKAGSFEVPHDFALSSPDTILHLGGRIVSKGWLKWTKSLVGSKINLIHLTSTGQTINPHGLPIQKICTPLTDLENKVKGAAASPEFNSEWQQAIATRDDAVRKILSEEVELSEPVLAFQLSQQCPVDTGLFIGNSTPIRDLDWFHQGSKSQARFAQANRGASGIDGLLGTATGYAAGLRKRVTVVVGDLSALHDLNSLSLVGKSKWPMVVIIINNQAGHIFDLLPIHESKHFEQFFATPHDYQFEHAARMFGIGYQQVTNLASFTQEYQRALQLDESTLLEVRTDRSLNQLVRKKVRDEVVRRRDLREPGQ